MRYLLLLFSITSFGQQLTAVDFTSMEGEIALNPTSKSVSGTIKYHFKVKRPIDTIKIDAKNMQFSVVKINGKEVSYTNSGKTLGLYQGYKIGKNNIEISYTATPKQALYFVGWEAALGAEQIWTQGQGRYTSHWLPSFDDVNEKVIFNLAIGFNEAYQVISNGVLQKTTVSPTDKQHKIWHFQMNQPMSSYLVMLAVGKFDKYTQHSNTNVPIELYLKPSDASKFPSTYKYSKEMFDFLEKETGIRYPWKIYKQVPVHDFLYAGMENTSATIFSQDFVVDEIGYNDLNYVNVNAHELAHHWFGDLITAKSGQHHWLQEGFATYYALLAEKELFGDDYFYFELLQYAQEIKRASRYDTIPILNEKASSLTFYKKGAWALHYLREGIGEEKFRKAVKAYLKKYRYKNVETDDFLQEVRKVASFDTEQFKEKWLKSSNFDQETVVALLSKNKNVAQLFALQQMESQSFEDKKAVFENVLKSDAYYPLKQEVLEQLIDVPFEAKQNLLQAALQSNEVLVRQTLAETIKKIPAEFKAQFESLLDDKSYKTREMVLQKLWSQFPEERTRYLDLSQNWEGNNDKNLRITWLTLALATKEYAQEDKKVFYQELIDYASIFYDATVRQNALEVLVQINPSDEKVLRSLVNATTHHKWQFVKFAKESIHKLLKKEEFRKQVQELLPSFSVKEQQFLQNELK